MQPYQPPLASRPCGQQGLELSEQGLGCKSLSPGEYETQETAPTQDEASEVILRALSLGISFLNTSDLYGPFQNERRIGRTVRGMARGPSIMSKWGPLGTVATYARRTLEEQLRRLGRRSMDLWVLRGFSEPAVSVEDTMAVVKALVDEGKVKYVGLANCTADELRRAHAVQPISAIEVEWSLCARHNEVEVIPMARALGIGIIAWAPLGSGLLTGKWSAFDDIPKHDRRRLIRRLNEENFPKNIQFIENLKALADEWGCTPCQLALAWLHAQGDDVFPIPGSRNPLHVEENVAALEFSRTLTTEEIAELEAAVPAAQILGGPASSA